MTTATATQPQTELPAIGEQYQGGYFAGCFKLDGQPYALIVAPREQGEHDETEWNSSYGVVDGAKSYNDGLTNTKATAEAGSELARWALNLNINGHADWYIPSQDELEMLYRHFKPTTQENWQYGRSGINISAIEPTRPYTKDTPAQTQLAPFQSGGDEAFDDDWYWSSTQLAAYSSIAWCQNFNYGNQLNCHKINELRARAIRRVAI